jgi:hypothetical protein
MWHGVVVCNPFSDWYAPLPPLELASSIEAQADKYRSIQPISTHSRFTISFDPTLTTLRVYLGPAGGDTKGDMLIREVKTFGLVSAGLSHVVPGQVPADADPAKKLAEMEVTVGLMACSPIGQGQGPECYFREFEMREGVREEA